MQEETTTTTAADAAVDVALTEASAAVSTKASATEQKIGELEAQLREAGDKALRAQAELENFRKRTQRELAEERRFAIVPLVRDLLPVLDNLERAIEAGGRAAGQSQEPLASGHGPEASQAQPPQSVPASGDAALLAGVKMVASQLEGVLRQHHCVRIETVGAAFDPHLHQALGQEPSDQYPAGIVTRAVQAGYKLYDRVIRPAQVFVSTGPATPERENAPA